MNCIKAIIFDMDGVMFDTERLYDEAFLAVSQKWGYENEISESFIKSIKGKVQEDVKVLFKQLLDKISFEKEGKEFDFEEYMKQVLNYTDEIIIDKGIPIKEGLIELLHYAKKNNLKTAIGTSTKLQRVEFYLNKANIDKNNFDAIVCGNMVKNGKPAPDIYLKACEEISINPENAIICEDAPNGIIAAHRSGAKPIMVIDRIEPTDEIKSLLFVKPLNSLTQVQEIINNK